MEDTEKKRYNIGLVVADITKTFDSMLAQGAMSVAKRMDANLFIFPGKYVGKDIYSANIDTKFEYQHNTLFAHAIAAKFDYLIVAVGTIAHVLDDEQRRKMLGYFGEKNILSVSSKVENYDFVSYDNKSGIIAAVDYLAQVQGRKNIAIMAGDLENYECSERYAAYREGLEKNGLQFKNSYCVPSDMSRHVAKDAEKLIVLNPEIDAVICANDMIALSLYEVLHKHNKHIGKDISVVGFDDLPFSEKLEPPLSSVKADSYKLGELAMEKAINYLNGVEDDRHFIETEFIPRQSCYGQSEQDKETGMVFRGTREDIPERFASYLTGSTEVSPGYIELTSFAAGFIKMLEERFIYKKTEESDFISTVDDVDLFFNKTSGVVDNITKVHDIIDSGFKRLMAAAPEENKDYIKRLYVYFYKRLSLGIVADYRKLEEKHAERVHFDNLFIRDTLMIMENLHDSYARMLRRLSLIGSDTSFVYIFKEPIPYHYREIFPSDISWRFMGYAYGEDTYIVPREKQNITTPEVFDNEFLDANRRHTLVAIDLFSAELQYGILLCEPQAAEFFKEIELISYQMSSVVKALHLRDKQEKTFVELHSKNLALEDISATDDLTGVFNMRGFYEEAAKLIKNPDNKGARYIVCYTDMNDLKKINERYGHDEGDFAIKALADSLQNTLGKTAIVGRMSGDEFAAFVPKKGVGELFDIQRRCKKIIEALNFDSGKPYLITAEMGLLECECADSYDLKEYVDKAYGMLCEAKSRHKKGSSKPMAAPLPPLPPLDD